MTLANPASRKKLTCGLALLLAVMPPLFAARQDQRQEGKAQPERAPAPPRAATVERFNHGSIRHVDTHVVQRPVVPPHAIDVRREVDVDIHRPRFWNDFAYGRRMRSLPTGWISLVVGGAPFFYCNGIYYQQQAGQYEEVYPPIGAAVSVLPDGAIAVEAGNETYYYAGGAFYMQQGGVFVIAPTPIGVVVPELPPGAVEVSVNGAVAYQFNGVYYQPIFVDGVTQYQTFLP